MMTFKFFLLPHIYTAGLLPPLLGWPPAHGQGSLEQYAHSSCKQEDLF